MKIINTKEALRVVYLTLAVILLVALIILLHVSIAGGWIP
jgi:hypothetical protein